MTDDMVQAVVDAVKEHTAGSVSMLGVMIGADTARAALEAALAVAPTADGMVWCDAHTVEMPLNAAGVPQCRRMANCPGPFRTLIIGDDRGA